MDKSWMIKPRLSQDYIIGVKGFLDFAFGKIKVDMLKCPCQRCCLVKNKLRVDIEDDLMCHGFLHTYTNWFLHGEELDHDPNLGQQSNQTTDFLDEGIPSISMEADDTPYMSPNLDHDPNLCQQTNNVENTTLDLLDDVFPSISMETDDTHTSEDPLKQKRAFDELLSDCNQALYDGCQSFSKLSFMLKLYHIKCLSRISDKGMSMIIDLLKEAFEHAKLPESFNDMKKTIRKLGLTYETIHACPNDCMLYWGEDASREKCKVCANSRWKASIVVDAPERTKKRKKQQAAKILRYFPLKPRLQRLYMSSKTAEHMRWHAESENKDGKLRHPRDGAAWKKFNQQFPEFASDQRNVRLGLATDGFNPFGKVSTTYSVWPVILLPYNLPPWMAMKQTSMILSMIIPGKHMPGNDIDIYLQPLIQELKDLWYEGVQTYDASKKDTFCMRAALLWTISDFPGLGNLSGWNTYTGLACPSCNYDAKEIRLHYGKKSCFMGHRRFLPHNHSFRKDKKQFDGSIESRPPPTTPSGSTIFQQIENVDVTLGKIADSGRKRGRPGKSEVHQWRKKSIFFELPYWKHLLLRHNLDVMHIEKNVFDNLIFTLLDDKGKSKDNLAARKDLKRLCIRPELWPDESDGYLPACFTMTSKEKDSFLNILKSVKLPDGYSSNISNCVDLNQRKMVGLKSHDCHILMGQLLSIAIRNTLPREVSFVVAELCHFFQKICSKVLDINGLDKLQEHIALTLCHLEMVFPPSFFTIMMHLTIHLTEEVKLGGPVQFRWMYHVERILGHFKYHVRNRARPEGSICEQYIAEECLTFSSMYLSGIETRFNRVGRVDDRPMVEKDLGSNSKIPLIFPSIGRFVSASKLDTLSHVEWQQAHRYILFNYPFLDEYRERYKNELRRSQFRRRKRGSVIDIDRHVHLNFGKWLKGRIEKNDISSISDDVRCLSQGPCYKARKFSAFNVNGFKFRTIERDQELKTQNSGVFLSAETISYASSNDVNPRAGAVPYYGKLVEILELNYYDSFRVVLFKCKWADTRDCRGYKKDAFGHDTVNFSRTIHSGNGEEDEPYVLASQVRMVYYVDDPQEKGWSVAVQVQPRDFYDMGDSEVPSDYDVTSVEDSTIQSSILVSDSSPNFTLARQLDDFDNSQALNDLDDTMEV